MFTDHGKKVLKIVPAERVHPFIFVHKLYEINLYARLCYMTIPAMLSPYWAKGTGESSDIN